MRVNFEQLIAQVADESHSQDQGVHISPQTREAYQKLLALYYAIVTPVLNTFPANDRAVSRYCMHFIDDATRTILMIRAINRAILARRKNNVHDLVVVEAGVGAGLLIGAALALDPQLSVIGYEHMPSNYFITRVLIDQLRYSDRTKIQRLNMLKTPPDVKPDVLIAEHIDPGLVAEHATQIPRLFAIDPHYVVPYAVTPCVYWNNQHTVHAGEPIILADKHGSEQFLVKGTIQLPPFGTEMVAVCCDIAWGSPHLPGSALTQKCTGPQSSTNDWWENHLLRARWLPKKELYKGDIISLHNRTPWSVQTHYTVSYPIGVFALPEPTCPQVTVSNPHISVRSVSSTGAQIRELLTPLQRRWWKIFSGD